MTTQYHFQNERGKITRVMNVRELSNWIQEILERCKDHPELYQQRRTWAKRLRDFTESKNPSWVSINFEGIYEIIKIESLVF